MAKSLPGLPADLDQRVPALPQPGKQCIGKKEEGPGDIFCRFGVFLRKEPRPENPVDDVALTGFARPDPLEPGTFHQGFSADPAPVLPDDESLLDHPLSCQRLGVVSIGAGQPLLPLLPEIPR